ncbi:MAG: hypothetical protein WD398_10475 [Cyclobacteriaceae bacterium]
MSLPLKISISILVIAVSFLFVPAAKAQWTIDAETGLAFPGYNKVRIPNESGTLFSFKNDFEAQGPVVPARIRIGYTFNEKNHIFGLWAPLSINYEGGFDQTVQFQESAFPGGTAVDGFYQFNSYRLTYRRDVVQSNNWLIGIGFTAKIRDASVQLENEAGIKDRKDDLGFVPLLHLYTAYDWGGKTLFFEGDGLAGGPGRAFDLFVGAKLPVSTTVSLKAGYRFLEGGANVDEVYNFTLVQFAVLGLFFQW